MTSFETGSQSPAMLPLTPRLTTIRAVAQREAEIHGAADVTASHLVFAILWAGRGLGVASLAKLVSPALLEVEIKAEERTDGVSSPPAALILAAAGLEAQRLGHAYIGVEHVILALTREASGWLDEITAADGNAASLRTDVLARIHRRDS